MESQCPVINEDSYGDPLARLLTMQQSGNARSFHRVSTVLAISLRRRYAGRRLPSFLPEASRESAPLSGATQLRDDRQRNIDTRSARSEVARGRGVRLRGCRWRGSYAPSRRPGRGVPPPAPGEPG